jgi:sugar O-acyltransferase (sialic acid O-acetyltransferase NeuD family)
MTRALAAIYGVAGHGRETMPLLRAQVSATGSTDLIFVDDGVATVASDEAVIDYAAFLDRQTSSKQVAIAIADSAIRRRIADRLKSDGVDQIDIIAATAVVGDRCEWGDGLIMSHFSMLTGDCSIGRGLHLNVYSSIAHDCVIGDYVTFGPGARCNGNVMIENDAYIGSGAVIRQGRPGKPLVIGEGAIIGMGAVVTKDVPPRAVVAGNPARPLAGR